MVRTPWCRWVGRDILASRSSARLKQYRTSRDFRNAKLVRILGSAFALAFVQRTNAQIGTTQDAEFLFAACCEVLTTVEVNTHIK